ncbi:serine/threonine-protein phosphatase [Cohnella pontilimi]|uniref:Serine/threonine-protein phosphatase n=1 Tax=Cohnella pontilimi TaxID=2564100 RepID=A0A4V5LSQ0_9BACL|nr:PP2C family protein-serine/threonine phosphatase [Cohnella pontilimi]TJY42849.1 serine/threonine-protein phosphatase [Cohnella pontilimi]
MPETKSQSFDESQSAPMHKALQREIQLARNIQMKLLNGEKPELPTGEVSGISIPARLIGGDYFDFYPLGDGRIRILIGDVMGKGIPAAMLMILTRGAFRSAAGAAQGPGQTLTMMNDAIYKDLRKLGSFVTIFCADWEPATGTFVYANAGHSMPIVVRSDVGTVTLPVLKGVMIGGLPGQIYKEKTSHIQRDDLVFLYTDGIVEAQNAQGEMFKLDRLSGILVEQSRQTAEAIQNAVVEKVNEFTKGLPQKDDITMVILKADGDQRGV